MENIIIIISSVVLAIIVAGLIILVAYLIYSNKEIKKRMGELAVAINKTVGQANEIATLATSNTGKVGELEAKDQVSRQRDRSMREHAERMTTVINKICTHIKLKDRVEGTPKNTTKAKKTPTKKAKAASLTIKKSKKSAVKKKIIRKKVVKAKTKRSTPLKRATKKK